MIEAFDVSYINDNDNSIMKASAANIKYCIVRIKRKLYDNILITLTFISLVKGNSLKCNTV